MSKKIFTATIIGLTLTGCGSTSFFYKSGKEVHVASCTGPSWTTCFRTASNTCQDNGYDVIERSTAKVSGFFTNSDYKELIYSCNKINQSPDKSINSKSQTTNPKKIDQTGVPDVKTPDTSSVEQPKAPDVKTPDTSSVEQPKAPDVKTPDTSSAEQPKAPDVKTPDTSSVEQPKAPDLKSPDTSSVEQPKAPEANPDDTKTSDLVNAELLTVDEKVPVAKKSKSKNSKQKNSQAR